MTHGRPYMGRVRPYAKPWAPDPEDPERLRSAIALATFAVASPDLTAIHRNRLLKEAIWYSTEGAGKYATRYRSRGVLDLEKDRQFANWQSQLRHEHVVTRTSLVRRLLDGEPANDVLNEAIACVVTVEEHKRLTAFDKTHHGWERYRMARIEVVDMADGSTLSLPAPEA